MKLLLTLFLFSSLTLFSQETPNEIVLNAAEGKLGKRVKTGICQDLIDYSLSKVDRNWDKRSKTKYIYGKPILKDEIIPGDIIVYKGVKLKDGRHIYSHIAIIYFIMDEEAGDISVIEQNYGVDNLKDSRVVINDENISDDNIVNGKLEFYRPY